MTDEIGPIQPVAPSAPVRRLAPITDFPRRLGMRLAMIIQRLRRGAKVAAPTALPDDEPEEPETPAPPDPDHTIDRRA